jgi:hypothetical protein
VEAGYITGGKCTQSMSRGMEWGWGGVGEDKVVDIKYERQCERGRGSVIFYGLAGRRQKKMPAELPSIALHCHYVK